MSNPTAFVVHDHSYFHPECCPSSETGDAPVAVFDEDLARFKGDVYCEGCQGVINAHLTDYDEAMRFDLFSGRSAADASLADLYLAG